MFFFNFPHKLIGGDDVSLDQCSLNIMPQQTLNDVEGGRLCTKAVVLLQFIVIACLILFSEDVHDLKQSVTYSLSASRTSKKPAQAPVDLKNGSSTSSAPVVVSNLREKLPNQQVCRWEGDNRECLQLLRSRIPQPHHNQRWAFFGDSTMKRLTAKLKGLNEGVRCKCSTKTTNRCKMYATFGFSKAATWTPPRSGFEGPGKFGLQNPQCQDCSGCNSVLSQCEIVPCNFSTMSYFSTEYARDVEIQTTVTNTTQETIALYLKNQKALQYPFTCVVNVGLHDMGMKNASADRVVENIDWFMMQLRPSCGKLVWIQTTATLNSGNYSQTTNMTKYVNDRVAGLLSKTEDMRNWSMIVDPFEFSKNWSHVDNVHMDESWYTHFADLFLKFKDTV